MRFRALAGWLVSAAILLVALTFLLDLVRIPAPLSVRIVVGIYDALLFGGAGLMAKIAWKTL